MPKTRNFSDSEKRDAMDLLDIHDDINTVHLLTGINQRTLRRWRKKLRRQNATLSEKGIPMSDKRTKSANLPTIQQQYNNLMPTPTPSIQPPAKANAARKDSEKAEEDLKRLRYIRDQLLEFSCKLAGDLDPDDPDVNLRTMSLARTLDRVYWLDQNLYDGDDEADESGNAAPPNRIEYVYEGQASEHPPWHSAWEEEPRSNPSNPKSPPADDDEPNRIEFH